MKPFSYSLGWGAKLAAPFCGDGANLNFVKTQCEETMVCSWSRNLNFVLQPSKASVESQFELLQEIDVVVKCVCQLIVAVELCSFSSGEGSGQQLCSFPIG